MRTSVSSFGRLWLPVLAVLFHIGSASAIIPSPADFDQDGDVDAMDLAFFRGAMPGPGVPVGPQAAMADFDFDGDVDMVDGAFMQASLSGFAPASPFPAQDANASVAWTLQGPAYVAPGAPLPWQASVRVSGANQGLALYSFSLELRDSHGQLVPAAWGPTAYAGSFSVDGQTGRVIDPRAAGGPGFDLAQSPNHAQTPGAYVPPGVLMGVGAASGMMNGVFDPDSMTPGVGLDSAKSQLLFDSNGNGSRLDELYVLNTGSLDTGLLIPGEVYTLTLWPEIATVFRNDVDLSVPQSGYFAALAWQLTGSSFTFVVPEPASVLIMSIALPLVCLRRRCVFTIRTL